MVRLQLILMRFERAGRVGFAVLLRDSLMLEAGWVRCLVRPHEAFRGGEVVQQGSEPHSRTHENPPAVLASSAASPVADVQLQASYSGGGRCF